MKSLRRRKEAGILLLILGSMISLTSILYTETCTGCTRETAGSLMALPLGIFLMMAGGYIIRYYGRLWRKLRPRELPVEIAD